MKRQMRRISTHHICRFISPVPIGISLRGGDFMKGPPLTITEHHPPHAVPPDQAIRQAITTWLAKVLRR